MQLSQITLDATIKTKQIKIMIRSTYNSPSSYPTKLKKFIMPSVEHLKKDTFMAMFKCLKNVKVKRYVASILSLFYYHNFATDMFS